MRDYDLEDWVFDRNVKEKELLKLKVKDLEKGDHVIHDTAGWLVIKEVDLSAENELWFLGLDQDGEAHYFSGDAIDHIYERI